MTFKQLFFRIYDRKIMSGEITFSQSGIRKEDFTRLCTEENFVFSRENLSLIFEKMQLNEEERKGLWDAAEDIRSRAGKDADEKVT